MTHPEAKQSREQGTDPWVGWLSVIFLVAVVLMFFCAFSPSTVEQLLIGWVYFPVRVLPLVTVDPPTLILGMVCVCLVFALMHSLLRRLASSRGHEETGRWSMRSTVRVTSLFLLLFVAGTAMVGATHQAVWLIIGGTARTEAAQQTTPVFGVVQRQRSVYARSKVRWNLSQLAYIPGDSLPYGGAIDEHGTQLHGWILLQSPGLFYSYEGVDLSESWNSPTNQQYFQCALPEVLHPSISKVFDEQGYGLSHVAGNVHVMPIIAVKRGQSAAPWELDAESQQRRVTVDAVTDGTAHTIFAGQVVTNFRPWGSPANLRDPALGVNRSPNGFGCLPQEPGALFVMCDGSVRSISRDIDLGVMRALATPAGGEPVGDDF